MTIIVEGPALYILALLCGVQDYNDKATCNLGLRCNSRTKRWFSRGWVRSEVKYRDRTI